METKNKIRKSVFLPGFLIILGAGIAGLVDNKKLVSVFKGIFEFSYNHLSWLYQFVSASFFILTIVLMFSKVGRIRIGGKDAKPKYPFMSWFAMTLTGGITAGIVATGVAQPMAFFKSVWGELAGYGIEPGSAEAVLFALGRTFHEWAFVPYAFYGVCGVSIAYLCFNRKKPVSVSSNLIPLFGDGISTGFFSKVVDFISVLALAVGTVGTLGTFIALASLCLKRAYGVTVTVPMMFVIMAVTTCIYLISSLSGVDKGIRFFAKLNTVFFYFLMVIVFIFGGSALFIVKQTGMSLGYWAKNLPLWLVDTGFKGGPALIKWWTIYTWAFWIAYAPVTSIFLAQLSKGRTIREFLLVNWVMPSVFVILWFGVFGGCGINWQITGKIDLAAVLASDGTYAPIWPFIMNIPVIGNFLVPVVLFAMLISFTTGADNSITVISALSMQDRRIGEEAPGFIKIIWGLAIGLLSFLLMAYARGSKGNDGVRYMVVAIGSVLLIYCVFQLIATIKMFFFDKIED